MRRSPVEVLPQRRFLAMIAGVAVAIAAVALVVVLFLRPGGADSPSEALADRIGERADEAPRILVNREWGEGRLVLASYDTGDDHQLALAFAIQQTGWRLAAYTEESVKPDDVGVGSLLVTSHEGGTGQPAWSVAAGELSDDRIERVEIRWASGSVTSAPRTNDAYLVLSPGTTTPLEARYLGRAGIEIARVPIEGSGTEG